MRDLVYEKPYAKIELNILFAIRFLTNATFF